MKRIIMYSIVLLLGFTACCGYHDVKVGQVWTYIDDNQNQYFYTVVGVNDGKVTIEYEDGHSQVMDDWYLNQTRELYQHSDGKIVENDDNDDEPSKFKTNEVKAPDEDRYDYDGMEF
jgi:hypothetical protein